MSSPYDVAFSDTVKDIQTRKGSRDAYAKMAERQDDRHQLNDALIDFIGQQNSCFISTVSSDGQPYSQHRGGPAGFLRVLNTRTLAFVDFKGNRQFITQGNLRDNPKAFLFLMDYAGQRRLKLWGKARVIEGDNELVDQLMPLDYQARPEQVIVFDITFWDLNCHQHIPHLTAVNS